MSEPLKPLYPGEPVTLILPEHVVQVEVEVSRRDGFTVTLSSRGAKTYQSPWSLQEEGISWVRGYHSADSPTVAACRTAQGLSATRDDVLSSTIAEGIKAHDLLAAQAIQYPGWGGFDSEKLHGGKLR